MNILMTADNLGGVWNHALELAQGLQRHRCVIHLVVFGQKFSAAQSTEVARLRNVRCTESDLRLEWMDEPWDDLHVAGELLQRLASEIKPAVIHLNGYTLAAEVKWSVPIIIGAHSCVLSWWNAVKREPAPPWLSRYRQEVSRGLEAADAVVAPTAAMLNDLRRIYNVDFAGEVIENGIDPAPFSIGAKAPQILSAGRFWDEAKNLQLLDYIANKVEWPILVAGEVVPPGSKCQCCSSHVCALGKLDSSVLREEMSRTSIYVAPALYEPFGLAVLEAALSGCALVLADIASFRELWNGAAVLIDPCDSLAWAAQLNRLIRDEKARLELAERAHMRAKWFNRTRMSARYYGLYARLAGSTGKALIEQAV
jgi:glycogen(starch) synthase